jgi:predicted enzyme related to lactoylglutathione lyase
MKSTISRTVIILAVILASCTKQNTSELQQSNSNERMKNLISIVEIPTADFARAVSFYQAILDVKIEKTDMEGTKMGVLPSDGETVSVVLVNGKEYKPSTDGTLVYLNAGDDLQVVLDKVAAQGGKVVVPKTQITPDMGFFAMFIDSEGNKLGLHSLH